MGTITKALSSNSHFTAKLTYTENSTSVANNSSSVTATLTLSSDSSASFYGYTTSGTISINGTNYSISTSSNLGSGSTITVGSKTVNVGHNTDGSKTINIGFSLSNGFAGSASGSTSWTLTKINRVSKINSFTGNDIEGDFSATYTKYVSSYSQKLRISIPNVKALMTISDYASGQVVQLDEDSIEYIQNYMNTNKTSTVTLGGVIETWNGSTKIGESSEIKNTCSFTNANPTFTYTTKETDDKVIDLIGNSKGTTVIQNASKLQLNITPTAYKGATISSVTVTHNSQVYTATETDGIYSVIVPITTDTLTITTTDIRGLSTSEDLKLDMIEYNPVSINSFKFERVNPTSSNIKVSLNANYYNKDFGNKQNVSSVTWILKYNNGSEDITDSGTIIGYTIDETNNKIIVDTTLEDVLSYKFKGSFTIVVSDLLTSATNGQDVIKGIPVMDWGEHDIQVNGDLYIADEDRENACEVVKSETENDLTCIKYYDGTMIQTIRYFYTGTITSSWGGTYITGDISLPDYKEEFIDKPIIQLTVEAGNGSDVCMIMSDGTATKTNPGKFRLIRGATLTTSKKFTINVTAIGRWK